MIICGSHIGFIYFPCVRESRVVPGPHPLYEYEHHMHQYNNPILDWAINGKGEAPSLLKAKSLLEVLKESDADALKLIIDLEERHKRGLELKASIERGIENVQKYIDEKSDSK